MSKEAMTTEKSGGESENDSCPVGKWHHWFQVPEVWIIALSFFCFAWLALWYYGLVTGVDADTRKKAGVLLSTVAAHLVGGIIPGVSTCAASPQYSVWDNILINMLTSTSVVSLVYGFFCLSCRKLLKIPYLEGTFRDLRESANSQKQTWVRLGIPGIFLFVWIPLFMTGPIVGSILGRLIGLGLFVNLFTVISASLTSIITWVFFWNQLSRFINEDWLKFLSLGVVLLILSYILYTRLRTVRKHKETGEV
ncbi:MAG: small multi-drug export protein [Lentisphaeria bacterium]|jgi:uncharacterized membrane protein|nr:small multi-drug export protein [Lentisphaeria bacterium]